MLYGLLVKQNGRWSLIATTEHDETTLEWEEQYAELVDTAIAAGDVQDYKIVTLEGD